MGQHIFEVNVNTLQLQTIQLNENNQRWLIGNNCSAGAVNPKSHVASENSASDWTKPRVLCRLCHQLYLCGICIYAYVCVVSFVINHRISLILIYFAVHLKRNFTILNANCEGSATFTTLAKATIISCLDYAKNLTIFHVLLHSVSTQQPESSL